MELGNGKVAVVTGAGSGIGLADPPPPEQIPGMPPRSQIIEEMMAVLQ